MSYRVTDHCNPDLSRLGERSVRPSERAGIRELTVIDANGIGVVSADEGDIGIAPVTKLRAKGRTFNWSGWKRRRNGTSGCPLQVVARDEMVVARTEGRAARRRDAATCARREVVMCIKAGWARRGEERGECECKKKGERG